MPGRPESIESTKRGVPDRGVPDRGVPDRSVPDRGVPDRSVEARLISLPVREELSAAHDAVPPQDRELVVLRVETSEGVGWGECSALNRPTYTSEFARGAFVALTRDDSDLSAQPMLWAAWTTAVAHLQLKAKGLSAARWLGGPDAASRVSAGAALGFAPLEVLAERAAALGEAGFSRIKVKIQPGHDFEAIAVVRAAAPNIEVHVDANGSFAPEHLAHLTKLAQQVRSIEQPFAPIDVASPTELVRRLRSTDTAVVADESVGCLADAQKLFNAGALSGVAVKAPRVGGLKQAADIVRWCAENGVEATPGGMLECGLGRHALVALAAMPGITLTGDVSPARRWLADDPWADVTMEDGTIAVPADPGVSPAPDLSALDRYTLESADVSDRIGLRWPDLG